MQRINRSAKFENQHVLLLHIFTVISNLMPRNSFASWVVAAKKAEDKLVSKHWSREIATFASGNLTLSDQSACTLQQGLVRANFWLERQPSMRKNGRQRDGQSRTMYEERGVQRGRTAWWSESRGDGVTETGEKPAL